MAPVHYFSGKASGGKDEALEAALKAVAWLTDALRDEGPSPLIGFVPAAVARLLSDTAVRAKSRFANPQLY